MKIVSALMFVAVVFACQEAVTPPPQREIAGVNVARVQRDVSAIQHRSAQALVKADLASVERLLSPNYIAIGGDVKLGGREAFVQALKSGALKYEAMDLGKVEVRVTGPNSAVVIGSGNVKGTYQGKSFSGPFTFLTVYEKVGTNWRAIITRVDC